jgi:WD40 repeat protein/DNA-binding SARP family transcriptional activator
VTCGGKPVAGFRYHKSLALLYYLAVTARSHSRYALAGLLWGDMPESNALAGLSRSLSELRKNVGAHLDITPQSIAFNRESPYWMDLEVFEINIRSVLSDPHHSITPERVTSLREVIDLYRGDFLEGFYVRKALVFEERMSLERERLRMLALQGLHVLVAYDIQQGAYAEGIEYASRLLALEPTQEETHVQLMQLLALSGQRSAALRQFEICRSLLAEELGVEPDIKTVALFENIRNGKYPDAPRLARSSAPAEADESVDWGEAPVNVVVYGRQNEQSILRIWLIKERCSLVAVFGMGGIGKTALAAQLVRSLTHDFEVVIWRSLLNAPLLTDLLRRWTEILSSPEVIRPPSNLDEQLDVVFGYLKSKRCLLVLDNLESLLLDVGYAGSYRDGYEDYEQLFLRFGESEHNSCLVFTSREKPNEFSRFERDGFPTVKSLHLAGIDAEAGLAIMQEVGLTAPRETAITLIERYSGNPLALRLVSETIQDFFAGEVGDYLSIQTAVFDDIQQVLDQQFARLSALEEELIFWLAVERQVISAQEMARNLVQVRAPGDLLSSLRSLQHRSLLEKFEHQFSLPGVVMEYATERLIQRVCDELLSGFDWRESYLDSQPRPSTDRLTESTLNRLALLKAQSPEEFRQIQTRLILRPITDRLESKLGRLILGERMREVLEAFRSEAPLSQGYAGGNILNLLLTLNYDLSAYDFSSLAVWGAYLRGKEIPGANFYGSDLTDSVFTDTFGAVDAVAVSPDGQLIAAGSRKYDLHLYDLASGKPAVELKGHTHIVWTVAFHPGGKILASGSNDQTVRIWDAHKDGALQVLQGHQHTVHCVVFSSDGNLLASCSADQTIRIWDWDTGTTIRTLQGHTKAVYCIAISPDGNTLVSGGGDHTLRVWDIHTGEQKQVLKGHSKWVTSVAINYDGSMLASGSLDRTVQLWNLLTGENSTTIHVGGEVHAVAFHPDGSRVGSACDDGLIRLWDTRNGQILRTLPHRQTVKSLSFSPDGATLVSGSQDQMIQIWNMESGELHNFLQGYSNCIHAIDCHVDGVTLVSGSDDGVVRLWDIRSGEVVRKLRGHSHWVKGVAFSPDGKRIASGSYDMTVRLWETSSGQHLFTLRGHESALWSVVFSPDGQIVASSSIDQTVRLWDVNSGKCLQTLPHTHLVLSVAFSPDGGTLATGSGDELIRLWEVRSGECFQTLQGHTEGGIWTMFSPDGKTLASGSYDQSVRIWDLGSGQVLKVFNGHTNWISSVVYNADGTLLASTSADKTIRLWDLRTDQLLWVLEEHTDTVESAFFSPDGSRLASGSLDETIRIWDVETGKCLKTLSIPGPYAGMNIREARGLSEAQKAVLIGLGAVDGG